MASSENEEYRKLFMEESQDITRDWEQSILLLEKDPDSHEHIDRLFRNIHTLKGSAGFVNFDDLQVITHELESLLQTCRDNDTGMSSEMVQVMLEGHDFCVKMIQAFSKKGSYKGNIEPFVQKVRALHAEKPGKKPGNKKTETASFEQQDFAPEGDASAGTSDERIAGDIYRIQVEIDADKKEAPLRTILIQNRLEEVSRIHAIVPPFADIGKMKKGQYIFEVTVEATEGEDAINKAMNIDQVNVLKIEKLETLLPSSDQDEDAGIESFEGGEKSSKKTEEVVRVSVDKLDDILNLVGELVIQNSGFISTKGELKERYGMSGPIIDLELKTESLAKIARDLQDAVMKVRMLPVSTVFNRFHRVVRDLAKDRGKEIKLTIFGEETEIDKKVIDRIGKPLVHVIRNAVDHGIEEKHDRIAFGKEEAGNITLRAYQEGDHICIEVEDDGIGLDREKIIEAAVSRKYLTHDHAREMSDSDVFQFILLPGFSTAEEVSDISGRGVGLDAVKRTVEEMGGDLRIRSTRGIGTVVTVTLPLTMAIIPAILLQSGFSLFAIPLSSVREVLKMKRKDFRKMRQSTVIQLRDEVISVVELRDVLELGYGLYGEDGTKIAVHDEGETEIAIVIVDYAGKKIGVGVEKLLGNEEIVIKSLGRHYKEVEGLVGASILGNGRIVLILDVEAMVTRYYKEGSDTRFESDLPGQSGEALKHDAGDRATAGDRVTYADSAGGGGETRTSIPQNEKADEPADTAVEEEKQSEELSTEEQGSQETDSETQDIEPGENSALTLAKEQLELLDEINTSGAVIATVSMTELMGRDIRVSFPEIRTLNIGDVASELFGEEEKPVGGIYVGVKGDIQGGILTVMPMEYLLQFGDMLYGRKPGSSKDLIKEEMSGLAEMANILSASFIRAMADTTGFDIMQEAPEMSVDICLSVIDSVVARFNQPGEQLLLTEAELFYGEEEQAICYLLLFLEPSSIDKLVHAAKGEAMDVSGGS
jgi:two-component system chemotaxis sensor kinase CheA